MERIRMILTKALKEVEDAYLRSPPYWTGRSNLLRTLNLLRAALDELEGKPWRG